MTTSKIEWTDRSDWNPVRGCTRVSPGCGGPGPHGGCYAEALAARFSKPGQWGHGFAEMQGGKPRWTGKVELIEDRLTLPLRWRKPAKVFVSSTSDIFHESLPDEAIDRIFAVMALAPHLTFQVLTKRSWRMRKYLATIAADPTRRTRIYAIGCRMMGVAEPRRYEAPPSFPLPNVWLGVSVEDQLAADERIPELLATPAAVRWLSCEPLLGPVDLTRIMEAGATECFHDKGPHRSCWSGWSETRSSLNALTGHYWGEDLINGRWEGWCGEEDQASPGIGSPGYYKPIDWVVTGGESGPRFRDNDFEANARSLRDQCAAAGVPFFGKQNAGKRPLPADLMVREFPA